MVGYEAQLKLVPENDCGDEYGIVDELAQALEGSDRFTVVREVYEDQYIATIEDE